MMGTFVYLPISFIISLAILITLAQVLKIEISKGGATFVISAMLLACILSVIKAYKKLLSKDRLQENPKSRNAP